MPDALFVWTGGVAVGAFLGLVIAQHFYSRERQQWMRYVEHGSFQQFHARTIRPPTAEARIDAAAKELEIRYSPESVKRGMEDLRVAYRQQGLPVPDTAKLRHEAEQMLNAASQGESTIHA